MNLVLCTMPHRSQECHVESWYLLFNNFCERGKVIKLTCPKFSFVLDHPVAYEFPVWAIVQRVRVCFIIMVLSNGSLWVYYHFCLVQRCCVLVIMKPLLVAWQVHPNPVQGGISSQPLETIMYPNEFYLRTIRLSLPTLDVQVRHMENP